MAAMYDKILVSLRTPIIKYGERTLQQAIDITKTFGGKLFILHIQQEGGYFESIQKETEGIVKRMAPDLDFEVIVTSGDLIDCMTGAIRDNKINLVVIGARRRGALDSLLDGIVDIDFSGEIIKKIPCSMIIIK